MAYGCSQARGRIGSNICQEIYIINMYDIYYLYRCFSTICFSNYEHVITLSFFFNLFRAAPMTHGGSQDRGPIRAIAAGIHQSHSNTGSEQCLQPTP